MNSNILILQKHAFSIVKAVENCFHFILGKHTLVKISLPIIKFFLSQTYLSRKLAHWLAKIQEHDLTIMTSKTIKGRDLALHLAQHDEASEGIDEQYNPLSALFYIDSKILPIVEHPWYKNIVYYLKNQSCPYSLDTHQKRILCLESSIYVILGDFLFRRSVDGILLRCVNNEEEHKLLRETHGSSDSIIHVGGHFSAKTTYFKIIRKGLIGLQFFEILIIFQDLVTSARSSLGKNVFLLCLYNLSSLTFLFQNGAWTSLVLLILHLQ
jgi:hypothetical protein